MFLAVPLRTQLSGKYSEKDKSLFQLKQSLMQAGVKIDSFIAANTVFVADGVEMMLDSYSAEQRRMLFFSHLNCIRRSQFHVIYNNFEDKKGYIGKSEGLEIVYAMVHRKPIIMLYPPIFSNTIPSSVRLILERDGKPKFYVQNLLQMSIADLKDYVARKASNEVYYDITIHEEYTIFKAVMTLVNE